MSEKGEFFSGSGSPENVVAAPAGSCYLDTSSGSLHHKSKNIGSGATGWESVDSAIKSATVTLSAVQLKAIATATQLIAAPGTGKLIAIQSLVLQYKAGATPFTVPGSDAIYIGWGTSPENFNASDYLIHASGFLDQATSQVSASPLAYANGTADLQSDAENQGIYIKKPSGGNMTLGNGTLTVTVYYTVVALS